jgi:hypothetical protein
MPLFNLVYWHMSVVYPAAQETEAGGLLESRNLEPSLGNLVRPFPPKNYIVLFTWIKICFLKSFSNFQNWFPILKQRQEEKLILTISFLFIYHSVPPPAGVKEWPIQNYIITSSLKSRSTIKYFGTVQYQNLYSQGAYRLVEVTESMQK